jgi:putative N6-adenine-specific DNA methylase
MTSYPLFAVAQPGLEPVAADEALERGFVGARAEPGGVAFEGDPLRANRALATPTRILQRVARFRARTWDELVAGAAKVDWAPFGGLTPRAVAHKSRLYHTGAIAERLARVVPAGPVELLARLDHDTCELSVDTSGEPLHRRGWRLETGAAPLRETLAAGILRLAGWRPGEALYDPMCGSGTFLVEAATWAAGRAPGLGRAFACERWCPPGPMPAWDAVLTTIAGSDRSRAAVEAARRNAERAGIVLTVTETEVGRAAPPAETGLVVCNPPYGKRAPAALHAFDRLAAALAGPFARWRAAVLVPEPAWVPRLGRPVAHLHPLTNGGLRVDLVVAEPSER